ncbi:hypothetical protein R8Z50_35525 [Longispora sp. K20-0274]|uniref:hypothetical protein n=1 Tax=Longispora sp. K20-0274 TaxID=3088255 RepID=UPI00399B1FA0
MDSTTKVPVGGHLLRELLWCGAVCHKPMFAAVLDGTAIYHCSCLIVDAEVVDAHAWRQFERDHEWLAGAVPPHCRGHVLGHATGAVTYRPVPDGGFVLSFESRN